MRKLISEKRHWIETPQTPENARTRWQEFRRINGALQPWVSVPRERLLEEKARVEAALRGEAILASREYSFCLYPEETLREFFAKAVPAA